MTKGIIYYTDCRLDEPIYTLVQKQILKARLPIVSCSLNKPIDFGKNIVIQGKPKYWTMARQITAALEASTWDYVFFCEHDVLYPLSHFRFTPPKDDIFFYDDNVWRWKYPTDLAITHTGLISLSGLCANRKFTLNHYRERLKSIEKMTSDERERRDPYWARRWGYEPGTKKKRSGGFSDDNFEIWTSAKPMIDIRHGRNFSPPKVTLESYIHKPSGWKQTTIDKIPGWDLKKLFDLSF